MPKPSPSQEELKALLSYDPATGILFWKARDVSHFADGKHSAAHTCAKWNSRFANKEAFTKSHLGYRWGRISYGYYSAHRIIWKLMTGLEPTEVDHIDGDRANNRWTNLRDVTSSGNRRNSARRSDNTSGETGVMWSERRQRWVSTLNIEGRIIYCGFFKDFNKAVAARRAAATEHDFHPNHGRDPAESS